MQNLLKPWSMEYATSIASVLCNENILNNLRDGIPYPYEEKDAKAFIQSMLDAPEDSIYSWAIVIDGKAVGSLSATRQRNVHRLSAELGYYIAEEYWNQGYTTYAVQQACDEIFKTTNIVRIYAMPYQDNIGSCRVLEKAGFAQEGILHKNAIKNGIIKNMVLYAKLA